MGAKVTFDPSVHEIIVTAAPSVGVVTIDFASDVYSDGKEDWLASEQLTRHTFPIVALGGNALPGGLKLDSTFFVRSPWKIRPHDSDHEMIVLGNAFTQDGSAISLDRPGRTISTRLISTFSAGASGSVAPSAGVVAAAVWSQAIEAGISAEAMLRVLSSALIGNATGLDGAGPQSFASIDGTKTRLSGTVAAGVRTVTTRDGTP